jgi:hypothetical protein
MTDAPILTWIAEEVSPIAGQMMTLIEGPQGQQAGVTGDLSTRKIGSNGSMSVEGKGKLWYTTRCHF